ncbi:MAG: cytochrome oxidase complex biosis factor-like protein [Ramlibacter sp.]|jgi:surfeit locus 1 family protein|uniref:SURF1 family protein n=1 Tax=Ramlibacter sp. TaxID=1917967 RepID=UPI002629FFF4|nr:SURF1 family protein [Ramlibacter sp.]MDB5752197.1 cytochrome oxidase complex biosis factor-like protein [Ramlibacter sp.]
MLKRWMIAVAALLGIALTLALGTWQWGRAQQKLALQAAVASRQDAAPLANAALLARLRELPALVHMPVQLRGRWVASATVYLDNRQMNGKPGFYVVTPLRLEGSNGAVLVQRGWVQRNFARREQLPAIETPTGVVTLRGRLAPPPAKLYAFAEEEQGAIRQNLDLARFQSETGLPLLPLSVQQLGDASEGLLRQWPQAATGAAKNYGYAAQWWALSGLIAILYVWFQLILPRRQVRRP